LLTVYSEVTRFWRNVRMAHRPIGTWTALGLSSGMELQQSCFPTLAAMNLRQGWVRIVAAS
jgi:hypothetical protein